MGPYDCLVVGAGISGLSTAYALQQRGAKVLVVEASAKVGGAMSSEQTPEGFVLEKGPNTIVCGSADMHEHFANLGIEKELMQADRQGARRYLLLDGQLELIPLGPAGAESRIAPAADTERTAPTARPQPTLWAPTDSQIQRR
jgi:oxygen-dependent protoporphyrinogen oxidase